MPSLLCLLTISGIQEEGRFEGALVPAAKEGFRNPERLYHLRTRRIADPTTWHYPFVANRASPFHRRIDLLLRGWYYRHKHRVLAYLPAVLLLDSNPVVCCFKLAACLGSHHSWRHEEGCGGSVLVRYSYLAGGHTGEYCFQRHGKDTVLKQYRLDNPTLSCSRIPNSTTTRIQPVRVYEAVQLIMEFPERCRLRLYWYPLTWGE